MNNQKITLSIIWDNATKNGQIWTTYISQVIGLPISWLFIRLGISANSVTILAILPLFLGAIGLIFLQQPWNYIAFLLGGQLSYAVDCSDGQIARVTGTAGPKGAYLDLMVDRYILIIAASAHLFYEYIKLQAGYFILLTAVSMWVLRWLSNDAIHLKVIVEIKKNHAVPTNARASLGGQLCDAGLFWLIIPLSMLSTYRWVFYLYFATLYAMNTAWQTYKSGWRKKIV